MSQSETQEQSWQEARQESSPPSTWRTIIKNMRLVFEGEYKSSGAHNLIVRAGDGLSGIGRAILVENPHYNPQIWNRPTKEGNLGFERKTPRTKEEIQSVCQQTMAEIAAGMLVPKIKNETVHNSLWTLARIISQDMELADTNQILEIAQNYYDSLHNALQNILNHHPQYSEKGEKENVNANELVMLYISMICWLSSNSPITEKVVSVIDSHKVKGTDLDEAFEKVYFTLARLPTIKHPSARKGLSKHAAMKPTDPSETRTVLGYVGRKTLGQALQTIGASMAMMPTYQDDHQKTLDVQGQSLILPTAFNDDGELVTQIPPEWKSIVSATLRLAQVLAHANATNPQDLETQLKSRNSAGLFDAAEQRLNNSKDIEADMKMILHELFTFLSATDLEAIFMLIKSLGIPSKWGKIENKLNDMKQSFMKQWTAEVFNRQHPAIQSSEKKSSALDSIVQYHYGLVAWFVAEMKNVKFPHALSSLVHHSASVRNAREYTRHNKDGIVIPSIAPDSRSDSQAMQRSIAYLLGTLKVAIDKLPNSLLGQREEQEKSQYCDHDSIFAYFMIMIILLRQDDLISQANLNNLGVENLQNYRQKLANHIINWLSLAIRDADAIEKATTLIQFCQYYQPPEFMQSITNALVARMRSSADFRMMIVGSPSFSSILSSILGWDASRLGAITGPAQEHQPQRTLIGAEAISTVLTELFHSSDQIFLEAFLAQSIEIGKFGTVSTEDLNTNTSQLFTKGLAGVRKLLNNLDPEQQNIVRAQIRSKIMTQLAVDIKIKIGAFDPPSQDVQQLITNELRQALDQMQKQRIILIQNLQEKINDAQKVLTDLEKNSNQSVQQVGEIVDTTRQLAGILQTFLNNPNLNLSGGAQLDSAQASVIFTFLKTWKNAVEQISALQATAKLGGNIKQAQIDTIMSPITQLRGLLQSMDRQINEAVTALHQEQMRDSALKVARLSAIQKLLEMIGQRTQGASWQNVLGQFDHATMAKLVLLGEDTGNSQKESQIDIVPPQNHPLPIMTTPQ